jgi:bifunctional non-homologous end joining protein LigD
VSAPPFHVVELMHPPLVHQPFHRDGWVYEEKVDGYRLLACSAGGGARLVSRNGRDHTTRFPGVTAAVLALGHAPLMLDGEVAVFDGQLLSRFEWIRPRRQQQSALTARRPAPSASASFLVGLGELDGGADHSPVAHVGSVAGDDVRGVVVGAEAISGAPARL